MTADIYNVPAEGFSTAELAAMQAFNDAQKAAHKATMKPQIRMASTEQVTIQSGVITSATSSRKDGSSTAYAKQVTPGFIEIPGLGQTPIAAAKAGGILPQNWVEGQPLPFDDAPKAAQKGTPKGDPEDTAEDAAKDSHEAHIAKLAGGVLDQVDKAHGAAVTDALIEQVAESGDPESILDQLPKGFQAVQVKQVMAGYIAQANTTLAVVGSSVPMLEEMLTDDELRNARRATLAKSDDMLQDLGRMAVDRLAKLPQTDPETFQDMVDAMDPKTKDMLRFDRNRAEWVLTMPDGNKITYGAAVRMGIIRI